MILLYLHACCPQELEGRVWTWLELILSSFMTWISIHRLIGKLKIVVIALAKQSLLPYTGACGSIPFLPKRNSSTSFPEYQFKFFSAVNLYGKWFFTLIQSNSLQAGYQGYCWWECLWDCKTEASTGCSCPWVWYRGG